MVEIIRKIITNILTALYQPLGFAVLLAILFMFLYLYAREHGWKRAWSMWWDAFRKEKRFRQNFYLAFYTALILFRTLLNRNLWLNPLSNVMGGWGLYTPKGDLTTEAIENLILFIPFVILLFGTYREQIFGGTCGLGRSLWKSVEIVFLCSLLIESLQLVLRLGTFQLADLFYNTLGGLIGGLLDWLWCRIGSGAR